MPLRRACLRHGLEDEILGFERCAEGHCLLADRSESGLEGLDARGEIADFGRGFGGSRSHRSIRLDWAGGTWRAPGLGREPKHLVYSPGFISTTPGFVLG